MPVISSRNKVIMNSFACLVLILIMGIELVIVFANAHDESSSIGRIAGLWAATLLILQFVLSSRLKILDKIFGIDKLMISHKYLGAAALTLAILHPLLVNNSDSDSAGSLNVEHWPESLGGVVLAILVILVCTSLFRAFLKLDYRAWRIIHQIAFVSVLLVAVHAFAIGSDFQSWLSRIVCIIILLVYTVLFVWVKFIKPSMLKKNPYEVTEVTSLNQNVVNLKLKPVKTSLFEYLPGQFAFLRLFSKNVKKEEHPFTISSSPSGEGEISFTIKNLGDYTSTIGNAKVGDNASVEAPLGRFSISLYPDVEHAIFIAGGIGITPLLSMLRYLAQKDNQKNVTLIWANRTTNNIFLSEELESIKRIMPNLKIHHIISRQEDYQGLKGYLNEDVLKELLSPVLSESKVFLCGPSLMMKSVKSALRKTGFARGQIITENFVL